ncbi:hypothetical protein ACEPPN_012887 [Leptodophora sp. 'Broadleaf-Isolate-01']
MSNYLLQFLERYYQDSAQCPDFKPRDRPMEVLALGVARSGTDCKALKAAIFDLPAVIFAKELIEAYPGAKVILSTRDVDTWHRSMTLSIDANTHDRGKHFMQLFHPLTFQYTVFTKMYHIFFRGDFKNQAKNAYEYNAMIRGLVPKERFLEYYVSEGWEPLCEFLGKEVPER